MSEVFKIGITQNSNHKIEEVLSIEVVANKGIIRLKRKSQEAARHGSGGGGGIRTLGTVSHTAH